VVEEARENMIPLAGHNSHNVPLFPYVPEETNVAGCGMLVYSHTIRLGKPLAKTGRILTLAINQTLDLYLKR
jgi:hypothetical protein